MLQLIKKAVRKFIKLDDTFASYAGRALQYLRVKSAEDGIESATITVTDEKVKAASADPTAGYLDAKVDNTTIEVLSNALRVKAPLPTASGGTGATAAANAASGVCILDIGAKVAVANLGSGASATKYLRGDQTYQTIDTTPGAGTITTTMLKTATGEVSASAGPTNKTLPGGEYGFYPQIKMSSTSAGASRRFNIGGMDGQNIAGWTSYVTNMLFYTGVGGETIYAQQRYVTASGEDMWIFLLIDKTTKEIISAYQAPDHPAYGNGGDFDKVPHPFGKYDENKYEIVLLDKETVNLIKSQATADRSILTIINEDMKVDYATEKVYEPLHSGKFLTEDKEGKRVQVKQMVMTIPTNIKVRKLIKLIQTDKDAREVISRQRMQKEKEKKRIEDLIEAKKREIAITELKKEGKINVR